MSETRKIYGQMLRAQQRFGRAIKDTNNPHFRSRYADLGSVWEACAEHLHAEGLFVSHQVRQVNGQQYECVTLVYNEDGDHLECAFPLTPQQAGPQPMGSALTYARRYGLSALLGIIADEDDDGNAAQSRPAAPAKPQAALIDPVQAFRAALAKTKSKADVRAVYKAHNNGLTQAGYGQLVADECTAKAATFPDHTPIPAQ